MGVVWGARMLGFDVPERGRHRFISRSYRAAPPKKPIGLLPWRKRRSGRKAAEKMQAQYPGLNIAGYYHGYFWDDEEAVVEKIKASGAKFLFVAITSPKKERFINKWKELGVQFVMAWAAHSMW